MSDNSICCMLNGELRRQIKSYKDCKSEYNVYGCIGFLLLLYTCMCMKSEVFIKSQYQY